MDSSENSEKKDVVLFHRLGILKNSPRIRKQKNNKNKNGLGNCCKSWTTDKIVRYKMVLVATFSKKKTFWHPSLSGFFFCSIRVNFIVRSISDCSLISGKLQRFILGCHFFAFLIQRKFWPGTCDVIGTNAHPFSSEKGYPGRKLFHVRVGIIIEKCTQSRRLVGSAGRRCSSDWKVESSILSLQHPCFTLWSSPSG